MREHTTGKGREKGRTSTLALGLAITFLLAGARLFFPGALTFLDLHVYDRYLTRERPVRQSGQVVIVDLDDESLARHGQWPWPRYRLALLLGQLRQGGARSVALDILFAEEDRTSPDLLKGQFKQELGIDVDFAGMPPQFANFDRLLARILRGGPFVLSMFLDLGGHGGTPTPAKDCQATPLAVAVQGASPGQRGLPGVIEARSMRCPLPVLVEAAPRLAFFNAVPDRDNVIRRAAAFIACDGALYPSLGLAAVLRAYGVDHAAARVEDGQTVSLAVTLPGLGARTIPLDEGGTMLVNYRGPGGVFPRVSAADVMAGRVEKDFFKDRIVFLGTSAVGLLDLQATPFDASAPGVEVQATVADMVLTGDFLRRPGYAGVLEAGLTVLFGGLGALLLMLARPTQLIAPFAAACAVLWFSGQAMLGRFGAFLSPVYPMLALVTLFGALTFLKFWREERMKRYIQGAFSRFISPKVVEEIVRSPEKLTLTGEEREVTVLVADIRNFSTFSEKLTPTQTALLLQSFFTPITRIIGANMGTIDKFFGDAVMAFWNAPIDVPGHRALAVDAALRASRAADALAETVRAQYGVELDIGAAVHAGVVRVGNFGSEDVFNYTVIGDAVNLCWRLEGLTKFYGVRVIASDSLFEAGPLDVHSLELDRVRVKGKLEPTVIHALFSPEEHARRADELEQARDALTRYKARDFVLAGRQFQALLALTGRKLYSVYAARCARMEETPPPPDWDGVYVHTKK